LNDNARVRFTIQRSRMVYHERAQREALRQAQGIRRASNVRSPRSVFTPQSNGSPWASAASRVEAAGIEPASRDISMCASTCVVELFTRLASQTPGRQGACAASGNGFNLGRTHNDPRRFGISDGLLGLSDKNPQSGLPL